MCLILFFIFCLFFFHTHLLLLLFLGGIGQDSIDQMYRMTDIYYNLAAKPAIFMRCMREFEGRDFIIACYYFNMVALSDNMDFATLPAETVRKTDKSMLLRRCNAYPGQKVPLSVYNVAIAPCCGRVWDLMGDCKYGTKAVTYNIETSTFVCGKRKTMHARNKLGADMDDELDDDEDDNDDDEDQAVLDDDDVNDMDDNPFDAVGAVIDAQDDQLDLQVDLSMTKRRRRVPEEEKTEKQIAMAARKAVRIECRCFNRPPCGQPVIVCNLRGRALIWGNRLEKQSQIMFCPECASKHVYTILNFSGATSYRCNECAMKDPLSADVMQCAYCQESPTGQMSDDYKLLIANAHPHLGPIGYEWMYFCRGHFNIAKRHAHSMVRKDLWDTIERITNKRIFEKN